MDGGWGIDALLCEETRPHEDLDLALSQTDLDAAAAALSEAGFAPNETAKPGLPARLALRDAAGRQIDFHPLNFDEQGNGWQDLGGDTWGLYPAADLEATGRIGGREVRCLSAELQLRHHLGWSWAPQDLADLARLAERFGLPLPPG